VTEPDDVRTLLGTSLHGEPPSALDPARVMKLGKRRLLLQRTSATLGAVVIAGGITLGAGLLRPHDNPDQISSAATSSPPPTTISGPPSAAQTPIVLASDVIATQNAALRQEYSALRSGLVPVSGQLTFVAAKPSGLDYMGSAMTARLGDQHGTGDFIMTADVIIGADPGTMMRCDSGKMTCAVQTVDGISVEVETDHPTAKTTRIFTVALSLSGNVLINGTSDNLDSPQTRNVTRASPPLTAGQLARITAAIAKASP
jgi:hypothetical protein